MKFALLTTLCLVLAATGVFAQAGNISVYSDPTGFNCLISDTVPGLLPIYAVHTQTAGATASESTCTSINRLSRCCAGSSRSPWEIASLRRTSSSKGRLKRREKANARAIAAPSITKVATRIQTRVWARSPSRSELGTRTEMLSCRSLARS